MNANDAYSHIVRKSAIQADEGTFSHPWNPASQVTGSQLSKLGGLANRSSEELVYMMGGESHPNEVADFPALDRRMVKLDNKVTIYRLSDGMPFGPIDS